MYTQLDLFSDEQTLPRASQEIEDLLSLEELRDAEFAITDDGDGRQTWVRKPPVPHTPEWIRRYRASQGLVKDFSGSI